MSLNSWFRINFGSPKSMYDFLPGNAPRIKTKHTCEKCGAPTDYMVAGGGFRCAVCRGKVRASAGHYLIRISPLRTAIAFLGLALAGYFLFLNRDGDSLLGSTPFFAWYGILGLCSAYLLYRLGKFGLKSSRPLEPGVPLKGTSDKKKMLEEQPKDGGFDKLIEGMDEFQDKRVKEIQARIDAAAEQGMLPAPEIVLDYTCECGSNNQIDLKGMNLHGGHNVQCGKCGAVIHVPPSILDHSEWWPTGLGASIVPNWEDQLKFVKHGNK